MDFRATLDSGADVSIVNKRVADFLGIEYDESSSYYVFSGASLRCARGFCTLVFRARRSEERLERVPVLVALDDFEEDPVIGCAGVFDAFRITFDQRKSIRMKRIS